MPLFDREMSAFPSRLSHCRLKTLLVWFTLGLLRAGLVLVLEQTLEKYMLGERRDLSSGRPTCHSHPVCLNSVSTDPPTAAAVCCVALFSTDDELLKGTRNIVHIQAVTRVRGSRLGRARLAIEDLPSLESGPDSVTPWLALRAW